MTALSSTLVLGGARSGKSGFAERLVESSGRSQIYLATATAGDAEMTARIAHHRARRGAGWTTVEEPLALVEALTREAIHGRAVLVDCLTLWLSNLMLAERDPEIEARRLTRFLGVAQYPIVLVSNEIGLGLVPETPLGRAFRDAQGRLNQIVAATVPNVVFIAAGLPLWLKRSGELNP
ncbi:MULTISPECIES: bifunctional adenosylcobinamide kinase/adenosylcobinamide-phosphate guanylyltransferase [Rhodopseudomonas]|uniref:Bifunctional adenosylcobalamin biosynthesis protein n=1 Tax=Rhodopseudomonas palustris TaxID=1076 RepID=A0A0D7F1A7_RHOPL|nr:MULTISPECIES: bifunctional adenosylcobinamide kinase/adenosylcobinamide-phosphate guanylyltransferase [Rhodopseudomonas]KIZ46873.1 adenosylcobinamide kinase [Rhodopseudomonas palustris]MDF3813064.1 bifunctional adenosylcobinamide kinase/adenosylcobinamide-phosphate guanylyltransferase [Rhodopseudomonas sp. BAL398]WOK16541.1 bifunctional adenosylcobinamide kinase/adenosylcobinamide-phosphate guanylyltransferase [Rhodopseudomonas sp. BAL398]